MPEDDFLISHEEAISVERFYDYVDRKCRVGKRVEILQVPFLVQGKRPLAAVRIDASERRMYYALSRRWRIRS
jgi:hypothetical protein